MIRLISAKCPECGAALQFEEGRKTAYSIGDLSHIIRQVKHFSHYMNGIPFGNAVQFVDIISR